MKSWRVTDIPNDACCWNYHVETEDRERIADVRTEEDARLMAASWELLEACREALSIRDWVIAAGGTEGPLNQVVINQFARMQLEMHEKMRAAIAKAEGQP